MTEVLTKLYGRPPLLTQCSHNSINNNHNFHYKKNARLDNTNSNNNTPIFTNFPSNDTENKSTVKQNNPRNNYEFLHQKHCSPSPDTLRHNGFPTQTPHHIPQSFHFSSRLSSSSTPFGTFHPLIGPVYFTCESPTAFYLFRPMHRFTLADLVVFSAEKMSNIQCQSFLVHQILTTVQQLNTLGLNIHSLSLTDFAIDDRLCLSLQRINFKAFYNHLQSVPLIIIIVRSQPIALLATLKSIT